MKVNELFEAYVAPVKNKKIGFSARGEKVPGGSGKEGIPLGGTKEWLKTFGATETDVAHALRVVRQSPEYRTLKGLGLRDESADRQTKLGSITFVGELAVPNSAGKPRAQRVKFTVQANGKIDETRPNNYHRAPVTSAKPRIVPGDAVQSIVKSMTQSLEKLAKTMDRRITQSEQAQKVWDKSQKA